MNTFVGRDELMQILRIGHDTSMRGDGLSLHDAIHRANYRKLRPKFESGDLVPLIKEHPELIAQWSMYSADKRTSGGFALTGDSEEDVADYVVQELDFWDTLR